MIVGCGNLELALSEHGRGHQGSEHYLYVNDVEAWHRKCREKLSLAGKPERKSRGNMELLVTDPFRNAL